jgi:lipopolysaccharide export system permease protein
VLPWANIKKNELEAYTYNAANKEKYLGTAPASAQISRTEYIFVNSWNKREKEVPDLCIRNLIRQKMIYELKASDVYWDKDKKQFVLNNYLEKTINKDNTAKLGNGIELKNYGHSPEELFPNELLGQNKTTPELLKFIEREKKKETAT